MDSTDIPEKDEAVERTLNVIKEADKFNEWIYNTIHPFCRGKIFEIGSGLGNISRFFLRDGSQIMLSDYRQAYCDRLKEEFSSYTNLSGIRNLDLIDPDFDLKHNEFLNSFDTLFAINVIEHINDDSLAIENCFKLLKEGGKMIILVPAYQSVYNDFDRKLGHFRRYTTRTMSKVLFDKNLRIVHKQYFNFIGLFGWFVSGRIQKNESIPYNQMKLYNRFVPLFKLIDRVILNSSGLSVIVVGEKP